MVTRMLTKKCSTELYTSSAIVTIKETSNCKIHNVIAVVMVQGFSLRNCKISFDDKSHSLTVLFMAKTWYMYSISFVTKLETISWHVIILLEL